MDARILRAIHLMESRMDGSLSTEAIATEVGLSIFHFHRLFVRCVGQTPADYLRRIRLDGAALRLRWTRESVGAIATAVGYTSQAAFTRAFHERYGLSPLQFRKDSVLWPPLPVDGRLGHAAMEQDRTAHRCIGRRFFGPLKLVPRRWRSFIDELPDFVRLRATGPCIGLVYDDPRFTPPEQVRYDCCIVIDDLELGTDAAHLARRELRELRTRPGRYVCQPHSGGYIDVGKSYSRLLDHWIAGSGYSVTEDPAIEWYLAPPLVDATEPLDILLMLPVR
ncbi:MAG: AraC family transcriptional regulator [Burkholderiaceae bacterium]